MPTLAQLGVEIDPTGAKTGGNAVDDVLKRIADSADKMAAAIDRFTATTEKGMQESTQAMGSVQKAADRVAGAIKEAGTAATEAGNKTVAAADAATAAETKTADNVKKRGAAHKETGAAATESASASSAAAAKAAAAETKVGEAVQRSGTARRQAGAEAVAALEAATRAAQTQAQQVAQAQVSAATAAAAAEQLHTDALVRQADVQRRNSLGQYTAATQPAPVPPQNQQAIAAQAAQLAEAQRAAKALEGTYNEMGLVLHSTFTEENGLVQIVDSSQKAATAVRDQINVERNLQNAQRERAAAETGNNAAYTQQMQENLRAVQAQAQAEQAAAAQVATTAKVAPTARRAAARDPEEARQQKEAAEAARAQAVATKNAREEAAKLQLGLGETSKLAEFGQAMQRNSNLLNALATIMGPASGTALRLAAGLGTAAAAAERAGNSNSEQRRKAQELIAANDALAKKQAELTAAQQASAAAATEYAAAQEAARAVSNDVASLTEAETAATTAAADAAKLHSDALAHLDAVNRSSASTTAQKKAATDLANQADQQMATTAKAAQEASTELAAARGAEAETLAEADAAKANMTATDEKLAQAEQGVADAAKAADAASKGAASGFLSMIAVVLPVVLILAALAAALGTAYAAWRLFTNAFAAGSQFVTLHARFSQFVGDAKAAHDELERLEELGGSAGFSLPEMATGETRLLTFGVGVKEAGAAMESFAKISATAGKESLGALNSLYTTARNEGSVSMRQLLQLREVGVDLFPQLRQQTGLSDAALQHLLARGTVSFAQLRDIIEKTGESMKGMEIGNNTPESAMGDISTQYDILLRKLGEPISLALVPLLQTVGEELKSFGPNATGAGNFVADMITAVNGALKNGELGSLIYEVVTTGTSRGWSYVDKNWFEPAKKAISEVFGTAHFGDAANAVFANLGARVSLWFNEGGLRIYAYLTQFLYDFREVLANVPGLGDLADGIPEHSRTADQIYAQGVGALQEMYRKEVQFNNDQYAAIMRKAGIETGELTGAFGAAVKAIDIFVAKATGAPIAKAVPAGPSSGNSQDFDPQNVFRQSLGSLIKPADQQGYWTMLLKNPPESMVQEFARHNAGVLQRELGSAFTALGGLMGVPLQNRVPATSSVPAIPTAGVVPMRVEPAQPVGANSDLPVWSGDGVTNALFANTEALNRSTQQANAATAATAENTQSTRARLTFYTKFEDQYGDRIAYGGDAARAQQGRTAAVDPSLFPYGGTLTIPELQGLNGTGQFRAEDTGGAVKSRTASGGTAPVIDIYIDAANAEDSRRQIAAAQAKYGEYVNVSYQGGKGGATAPGQEYAGMPFLNRSLATGNASLAANNALPKGPVAPGLAPGLDLGSIHTDQDAITDMVNSIQNYDAALKAGLITQTEFNRKVDELRSKTIAGLDDPSGGQKVGGRFVSFQQQIDDQGSRLQGDQYDAQVNAHRLAMDRMLQNQRVTEDLMKTNDADYFASFTAGANKALQAYGTFNQQVSKMGSTVVSGLVNGVTNAFGEMTSGSKTAAQAFKDMAVSMLQDISKLMIQMALLLLLKQALSAIGGSVGGSTGQVFTDMAASIGTSGVKHGGGIAGGSGATRTVDLSVFQGATRYHQGGILPGEVPIIAKQGEGVFTPEQMANLAPASSTNNMATQQNNTFSSQITINSDGSSESNTKGSGKDDARQVAQQIDGLVKSTLVKETRRGGILDKWAGVRARP